MITSSILVGLDLLVQFSNEVLELAVGLRRLLAHVRNLRVQVRERDVGHRLEVTVELGPRAESGLFGLNNLGRLPVEVVNQKPSKLAVKNFSRVLLIPRAADIAYELVKVVCLGGVRNRGENALMPGTNFSK